MNTNLREKVVPNNIPAGLFDGTEVFYCKGEHFALHEGTVTKFENLPGMIKRVFFEAYARDKKAQVFFKTELNMEGAESQFKQWLFCKFGSLDQIPDYLDGKLYPDSFNTTCTRANCPGRGSFCGEASSLKAYDVSTLKEIITGKPVKQIADALHLSVPGTRSRINKLKEKLRASNMAALGANAAMIIGMIE